VIATEGGYVDRSEAVIDAAFADACRTTSLDLATLESAAQMTKSNRPQGPEITRDDWTDRSIQKNKRHANQENKQPHSSVALKNSRYWTRSFFRFCETCSSIADAVSREGFNETR
jgi:hypothetical protein